MGSYTEVRLGVGDSPRAQRTDQGFNTGQDLASSGSAPLVNSVTVTNDVTIFNWTATDTTMTATRVDTGATFGPTGTATFNATDATAASALQTQIRALGGIFADATVVPGATADNMVITVFGGYDITWSKTGGTGTITESGAAGSDTATPGSVRYRGFIPVRGGVAEVKRIKIKGFKDDSLDVSIKDALGQTIFAATGLDTHNAGADVPFIRLLTADGVAGEDGAAAANTSSGVFDAPFLVDVTTSAPINFATDRTRDGAAVSLVVKSPYSAPGKRFLRRSSGAIAAPASTATLVNLGDEYVNVKRIKLLASSDTSVAPTITDADGFTVYTKTSTNYTTAVVAQLSHEGVDQANNAVADLLDVVVRSPISIALTGLGAGTFTVETICEV